MERFCITEDDFEVMRLDLDDAWTLYCRLLIIGKRQKD